MAEQLNILHQSLYQCIVGRAQCLLEKFTQIVTRLVVKVNSIDCSFETFQHVD